MWLLPSVALASEPLIAGGGPTGAYPAVGMLLSGTDGTAVLACTASLVAPDWVLTANHCIEGFPHTEDWLFWTGTTATKPDETARADAVFVHAGAGGSDFVDAALLHLEKPLDTPPIDLSAAPADSSWRDAPVELVGFGVTAYGGADSGEKRSAWTVLDDYDGVRLYTGATGHNACSGDSGGPLLLDGAQVGLVYSIEGSGSDPCATGTATALRIDFLAPWIEETTGLVLEGAPDPIDTGEPGEEPEDDTGGPAPQDTGHTGPPAADEEAAALGCGCGTGGARGPGVVILSTIAVAVAARRRPLRDAPLDRAPPGR